MKLICLGSMQICGWSPAMSAPRPSAPAGQWSTWNPSKWPPVRTRCVPPRRERASPVQNRTAGSGRMTQARSDSWMWIGAPPKARDHSIMDV